MTRLRIALIGREAEFYFSAFPEHECRVIKDLSEVSEVDDLLFCLSFPNLVPDEVLRLPKHGVWVNHSSDLPDGRGWAPLQWSVLKSLPEVTVTLFRATARCDEGPWAFKASYPISKIDTIETLYAKDAAVSRALYRSLIESISNGSLIVHEQIGAPSYWPRRRPSDSRLDASQPLVSLWDHIRICDNANYPAFFLVDGHKVTLRYEVERHPYKDDIS